MKELQKLMSRARSAIEKYNMIEEGDKIAVGVSGGKDSLALLCVLAEMRRFLPVNYEVIAITLDMGFNTCEKYPSAKNDHSEIRELCRRLKVEYYVKETELAHIIFDVRKESNPCSLCARMRRGCLHDAVQELGCNKIALGHHQDDAVETFMLNLFFEGRVGSFSPVTLLSRKELIMIRPLILTEESMIKSFVRHASLPVESSPCPEDGNTERENMKEYLRTFDRKHRGLYRRIIGAMERGEIDGWKE
ncbi:MAG: tRNA 2-thiocytidine(32) synthetase TtcA [Clostridia bacterium]|nr:tRNA 2-thiocytidine(32) synthetase TtcA [Clostridia bacterium]